MECTICGKQSESDICTNCLEMINKGQYVSCVECDSIVCVFVDADESPKRYYTPYCHNCAKNYKEKQYYESHDAAVIANKSLVNQIIKKEVLNGKTTSKS